MRLQPIIKRRVTQKQSYTGPIICLLTLSVIQSTLSQPLDWNIAVVIRGSYTTTSKLYFNPDSPSPDLRSEYTSFDGLVGGGVEFRFPIQERSFYLAVSAEYDAKSQSSTQLIAYGGVVRQLPVTEAVRFIPLEVSVCSYIPLGSERFRMSMGLGVGAYYALRRLTMAGVDSKPVTTPLSAGLNIGIGFEYRIFSHVGVHWGLKFRDPEIRNETQFKNALATYGGETFPIPQDLMKSKLDVDGMILNVGILLEL